MWKYEPDEKPKRKHHWDEPHAGFMEVGSEVVSKCPCTLALHQAEALLNEGIPWDSSRTGTGDWPSTIYVVHDGVVYRAKPTVPGVSCHGFPELPKRCRELPRALRAAILARAESLGCRMEVLRWMNG